MSSIHGVVGSRRLRSFLRRSSNDARRPSDTEKPQTPEHNTLSSSWVSFILNQRSYDSFHLTRSHFIRTELAPASSSIGHRDTCSPSSISSMIFSSPRMARSLKVTLIQSIPNTFTGCDRLTTLCCSSVTHGYVNISCHFCPTNFHLGRVFCLLSHQILPTPL